MMAKIFCAGTTCVAAATTCASSGLPPISCSTFGRRDFSRVPLPAARMAIANAGFLLEAVFRMDRFGFTTEARNTRNFFRLRVSDVRRVWRKQSERCIDNQQTQNSVYSVL